MHRREFVQYMQRTYFGEDAELRLTCHRLDLALGALIDTVVSRLRQRRSTWVPYIGRVYPKYLKGGKTNRRAFVRKYIGNPPRPYVGRGVSDVAPKWVCRCDTDDQMLLRFVDRDGLSKPTYTGEADTDYRIGRQEVWNAVKNALKGAPGAELGVFWHRQIGGDGVPELVPSPLMVDRFFVGLMRALCVGFRMRGGVYMSAQSAWNEQWTEVVGVGAVVFRCRPRLIA